MRPHLLIGIRQAPPLVDTFIVPEVPGVLYALFDYQRQMKVLMMCRLL